MNIKDTQNNRNSTSLFFLFFKQNFIFIVRYTMKLLLEFANKVRSLFYPLHRWVWQKKKRKKKKRERETIVTMETTIQFRFSFLLPRFNGSLTCHELPTFWRAGQKLVFAGYWIQYSMEIRLPVAKVSFTDGHGTGMLHPLPAHLGIRLVKEWRSWEMWSQVKTFSAIYNIVIYIHI